MQRTLNFFVSLLPPFINLSLKIFFLTQNHHVLFRFPRRIKHESPLAKLLFRAARKLGLKKENSIFNESRQNFQKYSKTQWHSMTAKESLETKEQDLAKKTVIWDYHWYPMPLLWFCCFQGLIAVLEFSENIQTSLVVLSTWQSTKQNTRNEIRLQQNSSIYTRRTILNNPCLTVSFLEIFSRQ